MRLRFVSLLALTTSLTIATSGSALAQREPSPAPYELETSALESLCAANASGDAVAIATCVEAVQTILTPDGEVKIADDPDLSIRIATIIDEAVAAADGIDVQAAIDDAVTTAQDVDVRAMIDEAIASAREVDVQEVVDEIVADIEERDVLGTIKDGIELTRNVVGAAQTWVGDNPELVCRAGSASLGAGAAAVVGLLTESPGLALVAFRETEKTTAEVCGAALD